jgi:Holliday junction resolvasome RuvABC endonuclease subunit
MANHTIRVFAIDPGLTNLGWSLLEYDLRTNTKTVLRYGTITGKSLLKTQKEAQAHFEKRHLIVWELEPLLIEMFLDMAPEFIAVEEPFAHIYIQAYAALVIVVQAIRTASRKALGRDIYLIAPKEAKKAISNDGTANKDAVQDAINKNPSIIIKVCKQNTPEALTEHACDSIAVGVAFIQNQLLSILATRNIAAA